MVCRPVQSNSCKSKTAQQRADMCLKESTCCIYRLAVQQLCMRLLVQT